MRIFAALILLTTPLMASWLPAMAQPVRTAAPAQTATADTGPPDHQTYVAKAREDMRQWGQEVTDFNARARADANVQTDAARKRLNAAWADTTAEERKLETAVAADWEGAKIRFDRSSRHLMAAMDRARGQSD